MVAEHARTDPAPATGDDALSVRMRELLDNTPAACFQIDRAGRCVFVNRQWLELTGLDFDEALGDGWAAAIHFEDRLRVTKAWAEASTRGTPFATEYRLQTTEGQVTWVAGDAGPVFDDTGQVQGYLAWLTDISTRIDLENYLERALMEQVKISERVRRQEERFRLIVENTSEGIWQLDTANHTAFANPRMAQMLGCSVSELRGRQLTDFLDPLVHEEVTRALSDAAVGERVVHEAALVAADGSTLPVMLASARVGAGRTTDAGSLLIVTDLSSVRRAEARLHAVERQFKTVFERAPLGISIVGLDGRVFEVNEAMCDLTGFAADHLEGQTTESLFVDDDRDRIEAVRTALFVEGDAHTMMELRIKAADGSIRWVLTDTSVVRDDDDVPMYLVTLTADINERKLFEARLAHDASHDALTGLPNRVTMVELIEQALARSRRRGGTLAVMFIDLDRFKAVNDTMGHSAGDEVLIQAGNRIRGAVRLGDVVARYGGDEFVALCEDIGGPIGSGTVAARICEAIGGQFVVEDDFARIGASVGISLNDGTGSASDLLARADAALYEAKQSGRGRYVIAGIGAYSPDSAPAPATATATGAGISSRSPTP